MHRSADRNSRTFPIFYIVTGNKGDTRADTEKLRTRGGGGAEDLLMTVYRIPGETHIWSVHQTSKRPPWDGSHSFNGIPWLWRAHS